MAWTTVLHALWVFLPAYVANMSPVFFAKLLPKWDHPIDGGRVDRKGNRLLGPGKTWRGLAGGAVAGAVTALAVAIGAQGWGLVEGWDYGLAGYSGGVPGPAPECLDTGKCAAPSSHPGAIALFGAAVGAMALVGDAVKSYFKRRTGRKRGAPWVPFDQLDFVVFGVAAMFAASWLLADGWVRGALLGDWIVLATLFVLTPALHFLVNVIGYWLRLKEVPW